MAATKSSRKYKKIPKMSPLTAAERKKLPSSAFGNPAERKYPINVGSVKGKAQEAAYAMAAKKRAAQQEKMGNLSGGMADKIEAKAEKKLKSMGKTSKASAKNKKESRKSTKRSASKNYDYDDAIANM